MKSVKPKVYFYIPSQELIDHLPPTIEEYWQWIDVFIKKSPAKLANLDGDCVWAGPYNWIIQAFMYLRSHGFICEITSVIPKEGIIITHGDFLPRLLKPSSKQFFVEIKPDRQMQCLFANFVISQNRRDPIHSGLKKFFIKSSWVNYWPQPGLIPRDKARANQFENISFMGNPEQFLPDVDALATAISSIGLKWIMTPRNSWHDYRQVDAVVAVRSTNLKVLNAHHAAILSPKRKPATKLYNAWLAGVPAVLSSDIAFQDIKKSNLDYLEANSVPEIVEKLKLLKNDPALRQSMVDNGKIRAQEFTVDKIAQQWISLIENQIVPEYISWSQSAFHRWRVLFIRKFIYKIGRVKEVVRRKMPSFSIKKFIWPITSKVKLGLTKIIHSERIQRLAKNILIRFLHVDFLLRRVMSNKKNWRIGFLTDEFSHMDLMPFGGYGMTLKFVTDYFNNYPNPFKADVLMCEKKDILDIIVKRYHSADLAFLPKNINTKTYLKSCRLIRQRGINVFIGVDHYSSYEYYLRNFPFIPWVVWIKDPKDHSVWDKLSSIPAEVQSWGAVNRDGLIQRAENEVESLRRMVQLSRHFGRKIYFAAEAKYLADIAHRQYRVGNMNAFHWPKPIPLPNITAPTFSPKPSFLLLARLDPIKRPWIYFELAKRFKDADFYVAGKTHHPAIMDPVIAEYNHLPNLHFLGRVDGEEKADLLNRVWAVINTSIHEGVPVSILEGFSFGKPAIAALNPDKLTSKYGIYVGEIFGEGKDSATVDKFSDAVAKVINGQLNKEEVGRQARQYIAEFHSFPYFESALLRALQSSTSFEYKDS